MVFVFVLVCVCMCVTSILFMAQFTLWDQQIFRYLHQCNRRGQWTLALGWRCNTADEAAREFLELVFLYEKIQCAYHLGRLLSKSISIHPTLRSNYVHLSLQCIHLFLQKVEEGGKEFLIMTIKAELHKWIYLISMT